MTRKHQVCITGATGGLGKAFAKECADRGWDLYLTDLSQEKLALLADGLTRQRDIQVLYDACNLTDPEARNEFWKRAQGLGLKFDMLINVAGLDFEGAFMDRSQDEVSTIIRVNIEATVSMTRKMIESGSGNESLYIINVSSLASFYPMPLKAVYAASKRFLLDFSRAMRQELHSEGVRILALCPAGLPTKPDTINSIESQGWMGQVTTMQTGMVAARTINRVLANQSVYIPGWINQVLRSVSVILPPDFVAWVIRKRWEKTRQIAAQFGSQEIHAEEVTLKAVGLTERA
jgi:short-subunit dehydrogenase